MGMAEVWNFRDEALARIDLSGFKVRAHDAEIGKVVEGIEAPSGGYLVIDPGVSMPLGKQLLLPAGLVEKVDIDRKRVVVGADRKQIENAPEYDPVKPLDDLSPEHSRQLLPVASRAARRRLRTAANATEFEPAFGDKQARRQQPRPCESDAVSAEDPSRRPADQGRAL
jgi:hypothetical protein